MHPLPLIFVLMIVPNYGFIMLFVITQFLSLLACRHIIFFFAYIPFNTLAVHSSFPHVHCVQSIPLSIFAIVHHSIAKP